MTINYFRYSLVVMVSLTLAGAWYSCGPEKPDMPSEPVIIQSKPVKVTPTIPYTVVAKYPHDITAYTEGLLFHEGKLYESTGAPDHLQQTYSAVGISDLKTGKFEKKIEIDKKTYFGEGMLILKNKIYQLTYQNQVGFIYDLKTYNRIGQFGYQNKEGWGLTTDGKYMIMSDGTFNLTYLDPDNQSLIKTLPVTENGYALGALNELEYIKGFIYANVWTTNRIVKINPENGEVVGELDLTSLFNQSRSRNINLNETNGIAYDSVSDKILVTGKLWPDVYEISFPH
jgi:glutaminyl-peptide cyclotransferase